MSQSCRNKIKDMDLKRGSHAGLLLQRYLQVPVSDDDKRHVEAREKLLHAAIAASSKADFYKKAYDRWKNETHGTRQEIEIDGRMVIGLGAESPLETGLYLHHTYGVPIIPGVKLKGLTSHYAYKVWGNSGNTYRHTLFGTTDESGLVVFHDAMIHPESLAKSLVMDVMTVHHPDYYQKAGSKPPSDFDSPTPISFLSVRGRFTVVVTAIVDEPKAKQWEELAMKMLLQALRAWGIGGKTSSGYGRIK